MIYDWYIQQQMQAATGIELEDEDFTWQFRGVASDHVNTRICCLSVRRC